MRPSIALGLFLGVALTVTSAAIGCRDSSPAAPQQALDNREAAAGGAGSTGDGGGSDSSGAPQPTSPTAPATPGPGQDTALAPPTFAASFTLNGVVLGAEAGADTTRTIPLAGVTARIYRVRAADGGAAPETLIGTTASDANGRFVFRDLASAYYRLDVEAPAGGPYADASRPIAPPWSSEIGVHVVLLRKS
jgi:hypothetical protein